MVSSEWWVVSRAWYWDLEISILVERGIWPFTCAKPSARISLGLTVTGYLHTRVSLSAYLERDLSDTWAQNIGGLPMNSRSFCAQGQKMVRQWHEFESVMGLVWARNRSVWAIWLYYNQLGSTSPVPNYRFSLSSLHIVLSLSGTCLGIKRMVRFIYGACTGLYKTRCRGL